jgi:hypothetical protein
VKAPRQLLAPVLVFLYLAFARTRGISQSFWLLGDQIRDWRIALGPWSDLPLGGVHSSVGGTTLGPVYTWVLWGIRHVVGPWTDYLPHAGGIGLSIIHSAADALLFAALLRRFGSLPLALAITVGAATAPYDMALTATIWNPPLAVAFVKATIALVVLGTGDSIGRRAAATATSILAVQAHSSAVFFAMPVVLSFPLLELRSRGWKSALRVAVVLAAVMALVEAPFLISKATNPDRQTSPSTVIASVSRTLQDPAALRPVASARAMSDALEFILMRPWTLPGVGLFLIASGLVTALRVRRDLALASVTVGPLLAGVAGFALWQLRFDHYWFLTLAPSAALTVGLALTAWQPAAAAVSLGLAALVLFAQPARLSDARTIHRLPQYEALVRGSREIRRQTPQVRRIDTDFQLPPSTDRAFLYEVLGGRVTRDSDLAATIDRDGRVTLRNVSAGRAAPP